MDSFTVELGAVPARFGHILMASGSELTTLENLASDTAMVRQAEKAIEQGSQTNLTDAPSLSLRAIIDAAESGDDLSRKLLADSGRWLGIGIASLINTLNPQLVIIAGEGVEAGEWRFDPMREAIQAFTFDGLATDTEIYVEPSGDVAWARGAATLVLDELFKSPVLKKESVNFCCVGVFFCETLFIHRMKSFLELNQIIFVGQASRSSRKLER